MPVGAALGRLMSGNEPGAVVMVPVPSRSGRQAPAVPRIRQVESEPTQLAKQYGADIRVLRLADRRLLRMLRRVRLIEAAGATLTRRNPRT